MKKLSMLAAAVIAACGVCLAQQPVNVDAYVSNAVVSLSATTPTQIAVVDPTRTSMAITFATNSAAGVGCRFVEMNGPYQTNWYTVVLSNGGTTTNITTNTWSWATQTNLFKAGTLYGKYIHPAGTVGSILVPVGWSYDAGGVTRSSIFAIGDSAGVILNVNSGTLQKP